MNGLFGKYQVLLAPMAGVSDIAMRLLCREQGADMTFTEMVSAKGLSYSNIKTRDLLNLAPSEHNIAVQLFGHEPETIASQAAWIEDYLGNKLAFIDINMGCPVRKIVSKGDGAALMLDPMLAERIITTTSNAIAHPLTCKFRRGFKIGNEIASEFAKRLEQAGVSAVTVHGRFANQMYQGVADWNVITRVKQAVDIPVVGNGDITCGEDVLTITKNTNCDAVMIARAAEGNPWVFADIKASLEGKSFIPPQPIEKLAMAKRHAALLAHFEGSNIVRMRKQAAWYVRGIPGASKARAAFNKCSTLDDFNRVFDSLESWIK